MIDPTLWPYILSLGGVAGIYIAGRKSMWGWALGLAMQVLWVAFAITTAQYGFLISAAAYGWVYGLNLYKWNKEKREHDSSQDA